MWITTCHSILQSRSKKKSWPKWKTDNLLLIAPVSVQVREVKRKRELSKLEIRLILETLLKWKWQEWIIRICILMFLTILESRAKSNQAVVRRGASTGMHRLRDWIYKRWRKVARRTVTTLSRVRPRELFLICAPSEQINLLDLLKDSLMNIQVYCLNLGGFNNNFVRLQLTISQKICLLVVKKKAPRAKQ